MIELITRIWKALTSMRDARGNLGKSWFRSKTLWVNIVAVIGVVTASYLGVTMDADSSVGILATVNFILRLITTEPVGFIED